MTRVQSPGAAFYMVRNEYRGERPDETNGNRDGSRVRFTVSSNTRLSKHADRRAKHETGKKENRQATHSGFPRIQR